ncbi:hypothetical protein [Paractinoplanes ferrugineus]|uniref:hypothetical protein n=1 Tax=Paractinoplanes ferrugineus TaxID=113564 RepID=UPI0019410C29|nr:hypothetical protein [Actinoplanes ferrugineus]
MSSPNPVTARARRDRPDRRRTAPADAGRHPRLSDPPTSEPPNVFIPVDVTSGPPGEGGTGPRPMS